MTVLEHLKKLEVPWYDPVGWPRWVRWLAVFPLPIIASIAYFFIYLIVNGLFLFILRVLLGAISVPLGVWVTALLGAILAPMAAQVYVFVGVVIAPSFRHLVGIVLAGIIVLLCGFLIGMYLSGTGSINQYDRWYDIFLMVLAAIGAIAGCIKSIEINGDDDKKCDKKNIVRIPSVIRWIFFLPVGVVTALLLLVPELLFSYIFHVNLRVETFLRLPSQTSQRCRALAAR
jgi:hypothetical protein